MKRLGTQRIGEDSTASVRWKAGSSRSIEPAIAAQAMVSVTYTGSSAKSSATAMLSCSSSTHLVKDLFDDVVDPSSRLVATETAAAGSGRRVSASARRWPPPAGDGR